LIAAERQNLRPPAVPLVAVDPYFCIWSPADNLTDADTVHWTGKPQRLNGLIRIDGKTFRLMGKEPAEAPAFPQVGLEVMPTRTIYTFAGEGLSLHLTFMTAALPEDLAIYSRPVTYVTWAVRSTDRKVHKVQVYLDAGPEIAVNVPTQEVRYEHPRMSGLEVVAVGSVEQPVLQKRGDDLRIDWGFLYLAAKTGKGVTACAGPGAQVRQEFVGSGTLKTERMPAQGPAQANAVLALALNLGNIKTEVIANWAMLAYDDEYSIQYFKKNLRPYWRHRVKSAAELLRVSAAEYERLWQRCARFDADLMQTLFKVGGGNYARICALAYRQCHAANKVVADANGQPLMFPKENFSNGCIGTVDVIYPMAPQFLLLSPSLTKAMLVPILDYAASPRWRWPFAPHDLGTYPLANGQVYGGGERTEENQMPVEETGNMLLLLAALAQVEGNADFCAKYWPVLAKWADYLKAKGFDPENQLCTDDFAGHLAHNVNLSAKAICGLGAFARLCELRGNKEQAAEYMKLAKEFASRWVAEAKDGDHYRLAFDKPGTWSQKYNLVWDRILRLNLFPAEVVREEMKFYKTRQNQYGLPLDVRKDYTKLDWTLWTAALTQDRDDFTALVDPVYKFLQESPSRVPMTDWYDTKTGRMVGFRARSVVGGVFLQVLYDHSEWRSWAAKDKTRAANWAPLPKPPQVLSVVPTSEDTAVNWRYTTQAPGENWFKPDFDATGWKESPGGFGTRGTPGSVVRTEWNTPGIWLRREFELPNRKYRELQLRLHHDEDVEVYLNGVAATRRSGWTTDYETVPLSGKAQSALLSGKNVLAIHCRQTGGGQYIDAGIVEVVPNGR
jgi:hypothetical protein